MAKTPSARVCTVSMQPRSCLPADSVVSQGR